MSNEKALLAITMGDAAGSGPEIIAKSLADPTVRAACRPVVVGDATEEDVLRQAGIDRAKGLITVLPSDADNLFVTLSARTLNPKLTIIARASSPKSETKMLTAGATRVLNPYYSGGRLRVRQLRHPSVTEFIDAIHDPSAPEVCLEEIEIRTGSRLDGLALQDAPGHRPCDW